ncbi:MAG: hypothetical protein JW827_07715 [Spirochaetes bacterium]|nr:hypothetical protein [Spirochaetota bacterium]
MSKINKIKISVIGLLFLACMISGLEAKDKKSVKSQAPKFVGIIHYMTGKAVYKKEGTEKWVPLELKMKLTQNDTIKTEKDSTVKIKLNNKKIAVVKPNTTVKVSSLLKAKSQKNGLLKSFIKKKGKARSSSPTAVAGVRGKDASKKKIKDNKVKWDDEDQGEEKEKEEQKKEKKDKTEEKKDKTEEKE